MGHDSGPMLLSDRKSVHKDASTCKHAPRWPYLCHDAETRLWGLRCPCQDPWPSKPRQINEEGGAMALASACVSAPGGMAAGYARSPQGDAGFFDRLPFEAPDVDDFLIDFTRSIRRALNSLLAAFARALCSCNRSMSFLSSSSKTSTTSSKSLTKSNSSAAWA